MRLASRVPGRGPKSPARTTHPQRESHSSLSLSLSPQHPPLVFEASENTMTRPPKSPPSVETGPPSSRAPPKRHPREKASRPLPSTSAFGQRDKKRARETGSVRVSTTRGPGEKTSLATRPPPDPLSSSPTHRTNTTLSHSLTLSTLPPLASRRRPDRNAVRPAPRIIRSKYTDPQSDVARAARLGRHLRSRYRCSMCSAVRMDSRTLLRSSSIHEPSDPPSKVIIF